MDLPSTFGAPRIAYVGPRVYWVRPLSVEGVSIILAWLDDVLPGKDEREALPLFRDPASQEALASGTGQTLLLWLALRDQGVSFHDALEMDITELERLCITRILFARRRSLQPDPLGINNDISETWCGKGLASLASQIGIDKLASLSLDQLDWLSSGGECDVHADPDNLAYQRACDMYNEAKAREMPEVEPASNGLMLPPGYRLKEDDDASD